MHLAGAVVNTKRAHVLEDAHDDGLRGHALTAEHLHAAIDHAPDRFGDEDLAHARFEIAAAALTEHPGRVPDRQARGLQNEFVVGQHEADALVFAESLAERLTIEHVSQRHLVRAPVLAAPAHAVRPPRPRQPDPRHTTTLADLAEPIT